MLSSFWQLPVYIYIYPLSAVHSHAKTVAAPCCAFCCIEARHISPWCLCFCTHPLLIGSVVRTYRHAAYTRHVHVLTSCLWQSRKVLLMSRSTTSTDEAALVAEDTHSDMHNSKCSAVKKSAVFAAEESWPVRLMLRVLERLSTCFTGEDCIPGSDEARGCNPYNFRMHPSPKGTRALRKLLYNLQKR